MPWRLAFALQGDGWILRSVIVWHKPHPTPTPIRDRLATRHEMIFLFVTQPDYYFDLDPIRQPYTGDRALSRRAHHGGNARPAEPGLARPRTGSELLERALCEDRRHRELYQRPVSAESLRKALGVGAKRSRALVKLVRAEPGNREVRAQAR